MTTKTMPCRRYAPDRWGVRGGILVVSRRQCKQIDFRLAPRPQTQEPTSRVPVSLEQVTAGSFFLGFLLC